MLVKIVSYIKIFC